MVLVIDNYDSFTYNLVQYLGELGAEVQVVRNDAVSLEDIGRLGPERLVISPGPGRPEAAGITVACIREFGSRLPVLGVCLGHQAIGVAYGGRVVRAPEPMHGKTSWVTHDGLGVYRGLPNPMAATRYHSLVVSPEGLPPCLEITAEAPDRTIMGLRHRNLPVEGVQFHPESVLTAEGKRLIENFLAR